MFDRLPSRGDYLHWTSRDSKQMFCTRRPARDLFYPQHFKRLNSSRRDPRPGTRAARRGETGPSACRLLLLPASEFWPKLKSVWQWPSFPINQVHQRRRLLAQRGSEERSGVQLSEYAAAASLQSAVLQVVECWLHFMMRRIALQFTVYSLGSGSGCHQALDAV